jgi:hypothetical protein
MKYCFVYENLADKYTFNLVEKNLKVCAIK